MASQDKALAIAYSIRRRAQKGKFGVTKPEVSESTESTPKASLVAKMVRAKMMAPKEEAEADILDDELDLEDDFTMDEPEVAEAPAPNRLESIFAKLRDR
jgi:hypothetical protein